MASKGSGISFGIRKATKADLEAIREDIGSFNLPEPMLYRTKVSPKEVTFIAFSKETIVGFITVKEIEQLRKLDVISLYLRLGFDRKGIGSKLLGKANAYAASKGLKESFLCPSRGYSFKDGERVVTFSKGFYEKTNYGPNENKCILDWTWTVNRKSGIKPRTPKQKPPLSLAPHNLLRRDAMLKRRRR